jgi:glucosamine-6-phosphate deaminase
MKLECLARATDVACAVARLVETIASGTAAVLVMPAGATPVPLYRELVRRSRDERLDLSRAHVFQLDELVGVGPADARGFHAFLRVTLLEPLGRKAPRPHLLDGAAADPSAEIARHARELAQLGGADLALLGLGANGHVAFNEPGSAAGAAARVVELAPETRASLRASFADAELPARGITLGMRELAAARAVCLIATGSSKAAILAAVLGRPTSPERPASLLLDHADVRVLADQEAASALIPA